MMTTPTTSVPVLALSATMTQKGIEKTATELLMDRRVVVGMSPDRSNIFINVEVVNKDLNMETAFTDVIQGLCIEKEKYRKTIIFCQVFTVNHI